MLTNLIEFNNWLFLALNDLRGGSEYFDNMIYLLAEVVDVYVVFVGVVFVVIHQHRRRDNQGKIFPRRIVREALIILSGVLIAWGIAYLMKLGFQAPRPYLVFEGFQPLFPYGGNDSFPSGHATLFSAMGVAIWMHHRRAGVMFILMAFLIGMARIIGGVHFPIDITAGWLLGGFISWMVYENIINRKNKTL